jgi:hypothetical protein
MGRTVFLLAFFLAALAAPAMAQDQLRELMLPSGESMHFRVLAAQGDTVVLWLPCDEGQGTIETQSSYTLARAGIEVWLADLLGAHFLPAAPSSMMEISAEDVAATIEHVRQQTGKRIYLVAHGRGAVPALTGTRHWQQQHGNERADVAGVILFFPKLLEGELEPGKLSPYLPITRQTSVPVVILQPMLTPERFWVERLKGELEQGGAKVVVTLLPGVRGFFYLRNDRTPAENALTDKLPQLVLDAIASLKQ